MNNTAEDTQLEYELQDLYISSKSWLSDISFINDEIRFFKDLIDKYFIPEAKQHYDLEIRIFRKIISQKETEAVILKIKVAAYLKFLESLVIDPKLKIDLDLIEQHTFLETEIANLSKAVTSFKKDLFTLTEKLL